MGDARNNMGNSPHGFVRQDGPALHRLRPHELFPAEELVEECRKIAAETGATIRLTEDVNEGTKDADVLLHRHLAFHGRARRGLGVPDQAPAALPGQRSRHGQRQPTAIHALPALLS